MKLNLNRWKKNHGGSQVNCPSTVEMDLFNENSLFKAPISPTILTMVSRRKLGLHIVLDKRGYVLMRVALDCQIIPVQTFPIIIPCLVLENHKTAVLFQFLATKPSKDSALLVKQLHICLPSTKKADTNLIFRPKRLFQKDV